MTDENLPVKQGEDFIAEFEKMDLSELKDKTFIVAISSGDRNKCKQLASSIHGPYTFYEMCEEVGHMWEDFQHHAKVTILDKNVRKAAKFLDENTVDYIEAHYGDIITDGLLQGAFDGEDFTCRAGVVESDGTEDPRNEKNNKSEESGASQ